MRTTLLAAILLFPAALQGVDGKKLFIERCAGCHGSDARGSGKAPGLAGNPRLSGQSVEQLRGVVRQGFPDSGMPAFDLPAAELDAVAGYVRSLNAGVTVGPPAGKRVTWGKPEPGDWLTYNGNFTANRYSELKQIQTANVGGLRLKWIFPIPYFGLEVTPLEAGGVMYVTGPNQVYAIDALTGRQIWKYSRPQTRGLDGDASLGTNRGVAIRDDRVFYETDNAHLLALDRATGELVWEKTMPAEPQHYGGTMAPLVVRDTVIAGVSGADEGIRGFIACLQGGDRRAAMAALDRAAEGRAGDRRRGREASRLRGGGSTWLTGSYDEATETLYWPTGNPFPDGDDADRGGDNLFTNCILALDPHTGELKWHYQFTPHDVTRPGRDGAAGAGGYGLIAASRGSCCCTRTATVSSMCWTGPTENCCSPSRFCAEWIGPAGSGRTDGPW